MIKVKTKYQCKKCDRSFDSQNALSGHQVAHTQIQFRRGVKAKTKYQCNKCDHWFSAKAGNYQKHIAVCGGNYKPSLNGICPHCNKDNIDSKEIANHARWCHKNPKRDEYINGGNLDKARAAITPECIKRRNESLKKAHERGCYDDVTYGTSFLGKKHTEETKLLMRDKALASNHRRLRRGIVEYKGVMLDSSWELELAKRLDELKVKWERPKPMKWTDKEGLEHNYFSDFYLPEYDLYLDPKNPAAYQNQIEKVNVLLKMDINIIFITTLEECKTFKL